MGGAFAIHTVIHGVDAVVLVVGDHQAAAGELGAVAVIGLRRHAGGVAQYIGNALGALVVHLLAGDHGDGLRCFAYRQRQLGRGTGRRRGVGMGALGGFTQTLGVDAGGAQFHRCAGVGRHQYVAAVGLTLSLQAGTAEQTGQAFFHRIVALQAGRLLALSLAGIERQGNVGAGGEQAQSGAQRARGDLELRAGALRHGLGRQQREQRQRRQGQAEQRQVDSANQRAGCARTSRGHAGFPSIGWAEGRSKFAALTA
ncbi:hypothetical protein D3C80_592000 [compost metagenome]